MRAGRDESGVSLCSACCMYDALRARAHSGVWLISVQKREEWGIITRAQEEEEEGVDRSALTDLGTMMSIETEQERNNCFAQFLGLLLPTG